MAPKIKLEVTHEKHATKSGGKLGKTIKDSEKDKQQKSQALSSIKQIPIAQNQEQKSQQKKQASKGGKETKKKQKVSVKQQKPKQKQNKAKDDKDKSQKKQQRQSKQDKLKGSKPHEAEVKKQDLSYLKTIQNIKNSQQKTKLTIEQLIEQYKNASDDIFTNHGHNAQKQAKIKAHLSKLHDQKQALDQKLKRVKQKQGKRHDNEQNRLREKQVNRIKKIKQRIKKRAENKTIQIEKQRQQRLNKQAQFLRYYQQEYKNKKFRYQKYQEQQQKKKEENSVDYKLKLKMIHNRYTPLDFKKFNDFQDEHNEEKWKHFQQWQNNKQMNQRIIQTQNYQLRKKIWKGNCHKSIQKQRQEKFQEKQKARTIQQKRKQYGTKIKYDYGPKSVRQSKLSSVISEINRSKQFQSQRSSGLNSPALSQGQVIKTKKKQLSYVYRKGFNLGPVIELRHQPLTSQEAHLKGAQYLQYLKSLPKVKNQAETISLLQDNPQEKKKADIVRVQRQTNPYYVKPNKSTELHINGRQSYDLSMAKVGQQKMSIELEQQSLKYGSYNGILDLQRKKNLHAKNIVQNISAKLDILNNI